MTEAEFQSLLLEMVRRDKHPQKKKILELLERSKLSCDKTEKFTHKKWDHFQEYIYLTFEPRDLSEALQFKEYIDKLIKQIYPVNDGNQIIEEIDKAKYVIWVAMAWFTNQTLYNALLNKKKGGVNVQIVIDDNEKNDEALFSLEKEFETYRVNIRSKFPNIMHDKFCIIDLAVVIHGTFNWTNAANYNRETISIDRNTATARTFADEFIKLKTGLYG